MGGGGAVPKSFRLGAASSARAILAELRGERGGGTPGVIAVAGAPALVRLLAHELREGGDPSAVREGHPEQMAGCATLVWIGEPDLDVLRNATRHRVPIMAVTEAERMPYVFETDLVRVSPGQGFPIREIAAVLARKLGDKAPALAGRLPVLRDAVVDDLIRSTARRNALLAAGITGPGVAMKVLVLAQIRLVVRIARARDRESEAAGVAGALGVLGAGYGFRAVARRGLARTPFGGRAVRSGIAFAGTSAIGAVARRILARDS